MNNSNGFDEAKQHFATLLEKTPVGEVSSNKIFATTGFLLTIERVSTEDGKTRDYGRLQQLTTGLFSPGVFKPAVKDMMAFKREPDNNFIGLLGHAYPAEVNKAMQELVDQVTKIVEPARAIVEAIRSRTDPHNKGLKYRVAIDIGHVMVSAEFGGSQHTLRIHEGPSSVPLVSVVAGFTAKLNPLNPVKIRGDRPRVYGTMDVVLQGITQNNFTFVREEIFDA